MPEVPEGIKNEDLSALISCPDRSQKNWPDFQFTLGQIAPHVREIINNRAKAAAALSSDHDSVGDAGLINSDKTLLARLNASLAQIDPASPPIPTGASANGIITDYPVFAALATQPIASLEKLGRRLQAHYLICLAAQDEIKEEDDSDNAIAIAALGLRKLATKNYDNECKGLKLCAAQTPAELLKVIEGICEESQTASKQSALDQEFMSRLGSLHTFLHYVNLGVTAKQKEKAEKERTTVRAFDPPANITEEEAEHSLPSAIHGILYRELGSKAKRNYLREASSPHIETEQDILVLVEIPEKAEDGADKKLSESQFKARSKREAASVKTSLQETPSKRTTLHLPALRVLTGLSIFDEEKNYRNMFADAAICLMLFSGCRLEEVPEFLSPSSVRDLLFVEGEMIFRLPVRLPADSWRPRDSEKHLYRPTENTIDLRFSARFKSAGSLGVFMTSSRVEEYVLKWPSLPRLTKMVKERLSELSKRAHIYLTHERISGFLPSALYALEGDIADSELLCTSRHEPNDSRPYYYCPPVTLLQDLYATVWMRLYHALQGNSIPRAPVLEDRQNPAGPHIGAQGVPLTAAVKEVVDDVNKYIDSMRSGRRDSTWIMAAHNSTTAALYMQVLWMTGIRPVSDVIELDKYDPNEYFMAVSDKDNPEQSAVRVVWLPPPIQSQVKRYLQSLDAVAEKLDIQPSKLAFRFISHRKRLQKNRKQTFLRYLGVPYPFKENSHRLYIRTRLRELGVDGAYVDALLGHAGVGREPYGQFSALTPWAMRDAIANPLARVWKELGFKPVI